MDRDVAVVEVDAMMIAADQGGCGRWNLYFVLHLP